MDSNLVVAIVTSITTAGSTAGVAITALMLSNKRIDRVEARLDRVEMRLEAGFEKVQTALEMLTGWLHDIRHQQAALSHRRSRWAERRMTAGAAETFVDTDAHK
jgi:hypothetical protein